MAVPVGWQSVQRFPSILWVQHHGIMGVLPPEGDRNVPNVRRSRFPVGKSPVFLPLTSARPRW